MGCLNRNQASVMKPLVATTPWNQSTRSKASWDVNARCYFYLMWEYIFLVSQYCFCNILNPWKLMLHVVNPVKFSIEKLKIRLDMNPENAMIPIIGLNWTKGIQIQKCLVQSGCMQKHCKLYFWSPSMLETIKYSRMWNSVDIRLTQVQQFK